VGASSSSLTIRGDWCLPAPSYTRGLMGSWVPSPHHEIQTPVRFILKTLFDDASNAPNIFAKIRNNKQLDFLTISDIRNAFMEINIFGSFIFIYSIICVCADEIMSNGCRFTLLFALFDFDFICTVRCDWVFWLDGKKMLLKNKCNTNRHFTRSFFLCFFINFRQLLVILQTKPRVQTVAPLPFLSAICLQCFLACYWWLHIIGLVGSKYVRGKKMTWLFA